ncbi:hypothetical protein ACWC0C_10935 [Streptomyces sp. NPDC001709]
MPLKATSAEPVTPPYGTKCLFVRDGEDVRNEGALSDLYGLAGLKKARHMIKEGTLLSAVKLNLPTGMSLVGDPSAWDCALIVDTKTPAASMRKALDLVKLIGLELIPEEEHEPELLDDGTVRFWLVPSNPEDPFAEEMEPTA